MRRHITHAALGTLLVLILTPATFATSDGKIDAVTIYQGQALVTRIVEVDPTAENVEIVMSNLPAAIVPESVYAEGTNGVRVRSVGYRERTVAQDTRAEVRALDDKLAALAAQIRALASQRTLADRRNQLLDKLENFSAERTTADLATGTLDAAALEKMTNYIFAQREELANKLLDIDEKNRDVEQQKHLLEKKRREITTDCTTKLREAVVAISADGAANGRVLLHYLVNNATWSPSYTLRGAESDPTLAVEYSASIQQRTGEDWDNVRMTLSTASPALIAAAPTLTPLEISFTRDPAAPALQSFEVQRQAGQMLYDQLQTMNRDRFATTRDNSDKLNVAAGNFQAFEYGNDFKALKRIREELKADEGISVAYDLPDLTSIPNRPDRQSVQIASLTLPANYFKVAKPVLTTFVYNEAEATNASELVLLAAPSVSYLDGRFVGKGELPTVAVGETFQAGFGIDASLRAERELISKEERTQGGNRIVAMTYDLVLENFSDAKQAVRLYDRLPNTNKKDALKVTLRDGKDALSDDPQFLQHEQPNGILRWDVVANAESNNTKCHRVRYSFEMEYDKQMRIAGVDAPTTAMLSAAVD